MYTQRLASTYCIAACPYVGFVETNLELCILQVECSFLLSHLPQSLTLSNCRLSRLTQLTLQTPHLIRHTATSLHLQRRITNTNINGRWNRLTKVSSTCHACICGTCNTPNEHTVNKILLWLHAMWSVSTTEKNSMLNTHVKHTQYMAVLIASSVIEYKEPHVHTLDSIGTNHT